MLVFRHIVSLFILVVITGVVYGPTENNALVYDSVAYLRDNPYITGVSLENLKWMFSTYYNYNWHPLTWLSYSIDYQVYGGLDPAGFHRTNVIIHVVNVALIYIFMHIFIGVVYQVPEKRLVFPSDIRATIASILAALTFAVHPQHVESVAWVAERKDVLSLFLCFWRSCSIFCTSYPGRRKLAGMFSLCSVEHWR